MKYQNAWYRDGSLRDIYVLDVNISHWQRVVDWLPTSLYPFDFYLDGRPATLPREVSTIFEQRDEIGILLEIDVEGVFVNCHFFSPKEVEFDIEPREVDSEQKEQGIADFMSALGRLLEREVVLTPENMRSASFLTYVPDGDEIIHSNDTSLEPIESKVWSLEDGEETLKFMARVHGVDENEATAILEKLKESANKPAYEDK